MNKIAFVIIITRNKRQIARILPGSHHMTAIEAMGDLYRTFPMDAADGWLEESRMAEKVAGEISDPWGS